jgi:hypothetical protein
MNSSRVEFYRLFWIFKIQAANESLSANWARFAVMKCHGLPRSLPSAQIMPLIFVTLPIRCHGDRVMTCMPLQQNPVSRNNAFSTSCSHWLGRYNRVTEKSIVPQVIREMPITVAVQSKAWIVFVRSNSGIVGSIPTRSMYVCVRLFLCVVLWVGSGLATGWSPVRVLPTVYRFHLCGLVVRVSGYRSRGPGFDSRPYQIFWEVGGLERCPLSLVRTTEELLEWKSSGSDLENRY